MLYPSVRLYRLVHNWSWWHRLQSWTDREYRLLVASIADYWSWWSHNTPCAPHPNRQKPSIRKNRWSHSAGYGSHDSYPPDTWTSSYRQAPPYAWLLPDSTPALYAPVCWSYILGSQVLSPVHPVHKRLPTIHANDNWPFPDISHVTRFLLPISLPHTISEKPHRVSPCRQDEPGQQIEAMKYRSVHLLSPATSYLPGQPNHHNSVCCQDSRIWNRGGYHWNVEPS